MWPATRRFRGLVGVSIPQMPRIASSSEIGPFPPLSSTRQQTTIVPARSVIPVPRHCRQVREISVQVPNCYLMASTLAQLRHAGAREPIVSFSEPILTANPGAIHLRWVATNGRRHRLFFHSLCFRSPTARLVSSSPSSLEVKTPCMFLDAKRLLLVNDTRHPASAQRPWSPWDFFHPMPGLIK